MGKDFSINRCGVCRNLVKRLDEVKVVGILNMVLSLVDLEMQEIEYIYHGISS